MNRIAAAESPPLRVLRDRGTPLPAPLTAFIGREKALVELGEAVRDTRLVTLTGPGGSGKTRLAIEAARALQSAFEDGVAWIELAPITDASLVPQTVASALGIRCQPGRAVSEAISEYLAARRILLVLDNCEHVIEPTAELVITLLRHAPGVHVLTTSRERLTISGERAWPVPPLSLPPRHARQLDSVLAAEAVRLFLDRAAMVLPAFAVDQPTARAIGEICQRVDGIPLAIELAAARMNVLSPRQIADRLQDAMSLLTSGARTLPKRQRTLRAAIDWSYCLLNDQEKLLFRRLSVFAGTFSLDAAEAVCSDAALPECEVLDILASLVDKSLVTVRERDGEARYRMLDTVDQYATEQLDATGEAHDLLLRHAEHYCRIVEMYAPRLRTALRPRVMRVLDDEIDNIRAALDWTRVTHGHAQLHHRMIGRLWWYWLHRVLWDEGMQRYSAAMSTIDGVDDALLAETLYGGGILGWVSGVFLQSRVWLERCVEICRELGAEGPLGMALCGLAQPVLDLGDRDLALALVREGMPLARRGCAPWDLAIVLTTSYGYVHHAAGLYDEAEQAYMEADAIWSEPADDWGRSLARNSLGVVAWRRGDLDSAEGHARESLAMLRTVGDRWFASRTLQVLGYIALQRGDAARATRLLAASEEQRAEVGARLMPFEAPEWMRAVEQARTELGAEEFERCWKAGVSLDFAAAIDAAVQDTGDHVLRVPVRTASILPRRAPEPEVEADLVIRALGPLEVRREGRLLTSEDWTYARPRELLFYLLSHEGGRTKEQIGLDLWPDATPAKLRSSFHVTVHHLRRALGAQEWVAFEDTRYRFEAARSFDYDVARFINLVEQARTARDAHRMQLLRDAVALYRGDFLEDAGFGDWSYDVRDRIRRRYVDTALELAAACREAGELAEAEATCRAILSRDNLDERAHRLLMQVLAGAGRPADALRHYTIVQALFREELGIAPSRDTEAVAASLRNG